MDEQPDRNKQIEALLNGLQHDLQELAKLRDDTERSQVRGAAITVTFVAVWFLIVMLASIIW